MVPENTALILSTNRDGEIGAMTMKNRKNIRNLLERLKGLGLQTSSLIPSLKAEVMKMKAMLFSTFVTLRQN